MISIETFLCALSVKRTRAALTYDESSSVGAGFQPSQVETDQQIHPEISELLTKKIESTKKQSLPNITETETASTSQNGLSIKKEEPVNLHIWDFAGHELYYTTHQVNSLVIPRRWGYNTTTTTNNNNNNNNKINKSMNKW